MPTGYPSCARPPPGSPHVKRILVQGGQDDPSAAPPVHCLDTLLEYEPQTTLPQIDGQSTAVMLYSSGTTGRPKGVPLSHANLLASAEAVVEAAELDRWEWPRINAQCHADCPHLWRGHHERFADDARASGRSHPTGTDAMVRRRNDSWHWSMSTAARRRRLYRPFWPCCCTIRSAKQYDLSSIKEIICGGAPLPVELAQAFMQPLPLPYSRGLRPD